jgi:polyphosphate glucokinase
MNILVLDVGGTHVKIIMTGQESHVQFDSGPRMTPAKMVEGVKKLTAGWQYDVVSIGCPCPTRDGQPVAEPHNLAKGWVKFNFKRAFGKPTKVMNDAAMQALGSYRGGDMLFLGLGTGLGSAMVVDGTLQPLELAHLPYRHDLTYEEYVGAAALQKMGKKKWRKHVGIIIELLKTALQAEYVVVGGGNARLLKDLPSHIIPGKNDNAFKGGFRLWDSKETLAHKA